MFRGNSSGRHQVGGILALLASGSLLLVSCAAVTRPDCGDWNTGGFFHQATVADVTRCLSQGADTNVRADNELPPLHLAAVNSENPEVVKALLDAGADLEARAKYGYTSLHMAASLNKKPSVVKTLLAAGANLEARDSFFGRTPLHMAAYSESLEVVKALLDAGADPKAKTDRGETPVERMWNAYPAIPPYAPPYTLLLQIVGTGIPRSSSTWQRRWMLAVASLKVQTPMQGMRMDIPPCTWRRYSVQNQKKL